MVARTGFTVDIHPRDLPMTLIGTAGGTLALWANAPAGVLAIAALRSSSTSASAACVDTPDGPAKRPMAQRRPSTTQPPALPRNSRSGLVGIALLLLALVLDRLDRGRGRLRVEVRAAGVERLEVGVELVGERDAGRDVQARDVGVGDAVEVLDEGAQGVAVGGDQAPCGR